MPQSLSNLIFHFVFSTQHRKARISRDLQPQLHQFIAGVLRSKQSRLLTAGGMPITFIYWYHWIDKLRYRMPCEK